VTERIAGIGAVNFPCMVLAGGASSRFGSPKGMAQLQNKPLLEHVLMNMKKQTDAPVLINANQNSPYEKLGNVITDAPGHRDLGPLSGILTAIIWAEAAGFDCVATVPLDAPILPFCLLSRLQKTTPPTYAATSESEHYAIGLWPVSLRSNLQTFLANQNRRVRDWVEACSAAPCLFDEDGSDVEFTNVNTPADLEKLEQALAQASERVPLSPDD